MAFPQVEATATSVSATNRSSHTVSLPTGITAGELLLVFFCCDGNETVTWPDASWNVIGSAGSGYTYEVAWREATGSEGSTITVTTGTNEQAAHAAFRISGAEDPDTQAPEISTVATGSGTANPGSRTPTGGAADFLWIANVGNDNGARSPSGSPYIANYSGNNTESVQGTTAGAGVHICTRELNASSEDPGTMAYDGGTINWAAYTIAVHPAAAAGDIDLSPTAAQLTLSGASPSLTQTRDIPLSPTAAQLTISGSAPTLTVTKDITLSPAGANLTITGSTPGFSIAADKTFQPTAAQLAITGSTPTFTQTRDIALSPAAGQLTLSGSTPGLTVTKDIPLSPTAAQLVITGSAPGLTVSTGKTFLPTAAQLVISGSTPGLTVTKDITLTPAAANLVLSGSAPGLTVTKDITLSPTAAQLVLSGSSPTLTIDAGKNFSPTAAQLTLTGSTPTLTLTADKTFTPGHADLVITGSTPSLVNTTPRAGGWWPIEGKKKPRRVRYAKTGRKILSYDLEAHTLDFGQSGKNASPKPLAALGKAKMLHGRGKNASPTLTLPESPAAALTADVLGAVQAPPQPVIDRGVVVELVKGMGRVTEQQKIDRALAAAIERDDEEALIMILLEAA